MTGGRPGPEPRRDPGGPRGPRRTLGPYGPRDEAGPGAADVRYGARLDHPGGRHGAPPGRPRSPARPWEQPGPAVPRDNPVSRGRGVPRNYGVSRNYRGGAEGNERLTAATGAVLGLAGLNRAHSALAGCALAGRTTRWLLLAASIAGGLLIAAMTVHLAGPWAGFHHSG